MIFCVMISRDRSREPSSTSTSSKGERKHARTAATHRSANSDTCDSSLKTGATILSVARPSLAGSRGASVMWGISQAVAAAAGPSAPQDQAEHAAGRPPRLADRVRPEEIERDLEQPMRAPKEGDHVEEAEGAHDERSEDAGPKVR